MPDILVYEAHGYETKLMEAEEHYYESMRELGKGKFIKNEVNCIGAGIGSNFLPILKSFTS
jgi:hypothetical protein